MIITWLKQVLEAVSNYQATKTELESLKKENDALKAERAEAERLLKEIMDALGIEPNQR